MKSKTKMKKSNIPTAEVDKLLQRQWRTKENGIKN